MHESKIDSGKSSEEIESSLQENLADGFKPTVAIVLYQLSKTEAVCELLRQKE
jgi:hypothetical protein